MALSMSSIRNPSSNSVAKGSSYCAVLFPEDCREVYIYIINPYEVDNKEEETLCRLTDLNLTQMAVAVLDSTLYMFGGSNYYNDWQKDCFSLPLSSKGTFPKSCFKTISPMTSTKLVPRATLIGDKICVISSFLSHKNTNFELYDPRTDRWSSLPQPFVARESLKYNDPEDRVCFQTVENQVLSIHTTQGFFCIDLSHEDPQWKNHTFSLPRPLYSLSQPFIKDGDLVFLPNGEVYHLGVEPEPILGVEPEPILRFFDPFDLNFHSNDQAIIRAEAKETSPKRLKEVGKEKMMALFIDVGGDSPVYDKCESATFRIYLLQFLEEYDSHKLTTRTLTSKFISVPNTFSSDTCILGVFPI